MANIILDQTTVPGDALDQQTVYIKPTWQSVWIQIPYLYCDWATWSVSGMRTNRAQLTWRYGEGMRPGETVFSNINRLAPNDIKDYFVRVDFGPWRWVGSIEQIGDSLQGASSVPAGEQKILCYGMEFQLEQHKVLTSEAQVNTTLTRSTIQRGITFNHNGRGNRSANQYTTGASSHFIFGHDDVNFVGQSERWSTRNIVQYLLALQTNPSTLAPSNPIIWELDSMSLDFLPDYDAPELDQHNRRVQDLLDTLISPQRFMTWWYDYDLTNNKMIVKIGTFTDVNIMRPPPDQAEILIKANPNVDTLSIERDPAAENAVYRHNTLDLVQQVVVQGARRTSTFSMNADADSTVVAGWTPAEESAYNQGASNLGAAEYPPGRILLQRKANAEVRSRDELAKVYSELRLPQDWNRLAGDGQGNEVNAVFPDENVPPNAVQLYSKEAYFAQNLTLLKGRDYSSNNINQGSFRTHEEQPQEPMKPFALAPNPQQRTVSPPSDRKYVFSDRLGRISEYSNQDNSWTSERFIQEEYSVRMRILPESTTILLEVVGVDQQHVIARNQFVGVGSPVDGYEGKPEWDWREWIFTVTIVEDRYAESVYPATIPLADSVKKLVIDAGDSYRRDYVTPYTIVGVDSKRNLVRSTSGGYVVDDKPRMDQVAQLAYQWYSKPRTTVEFTTVFRSPAENIRLGNYIKSINSSNNLQAVDSLVTELRIAHSEVSGSQNVGNAMLTVETGFAEVDPASFLATFG